MFFPPLAPFFVFKTSSSKFDVLGVTPLDD